MTVNRAGTFLEALFLDDNVVFLVAEEEDFFADVRFLVIMMVVGRALGGHTRTKDTEALSHEALRPRDA